MTKRKVICDIEADSLQPTVIWCVVCKDIDTGDEFIFKQHDAGKFREFANQVTMWVGHNFISYDAPALNKLWGTKIKVSQIRDTLVMSRLFNSCREVMTESGKKVRQKRSSHSLESWGETLGYPKIDFHDFSKYSEEMLTYCIQDVRLNLRVYQELMKESKGFSQLSLDLEHRIQHILYKQRENGFKINLPEAHKLLKHCMMRATQIEESIQRDFPPLPKFIRGYAPKRTKDGGYNRATMGPLRDLYPFQYTGDPYSLIEWKPFNLGSPTQVVERLEGHWAPFELTPSGKSFKISEKNLATIRDSAPQSIKNIKLFRMYQSRINELKQWIEGAEKHPDGRLRGNVIHLGSWSGRMSHNNPNTANIAGVNHGKDGILYGEEGNYGYECRSLWTVDKGNVLVGTDASGIQLRVLAHYLNNPTYTKAVLTDIHSFNADILGCDRPTAKTFIYSWLLGAGVAKTAAILNCSHGEAVRKRERFVQLTPGLEDFMKEKTQAAKRGWYWGLDGRKVYVPSDHLALTAYLQQGEGAIMKYWNIIWGQWARSENILYKQCAIVHDETQCEVRKDQAERFGQLQVAAFPKVSELLNLNVPLAGEYNVGRNWAETH